MPVRVDATINRLNEYDFGRIAYDVMRCVFEIHNDLGRLFNEMFYKQELRLRYPGTQLEVPITVSFDNFRKIYYLDALIGGSAPFEFKTVESLTERHRSQLRHYLLLTELPHGKLVNMRPEQVEHEFVNTSLRAQSRTVFGINDRDWQEIGDDRVMEWCIAFLNDVGTCLDISLYEDALTHKLGGEDRVLQDIEVKTNGGFLGLQKFRLLAPGVAFKVTVLPDNLGHFEIHTRRLLDHTNLEAIQWININRKLVSFKTVQK